MNRRQYSVERLLRFSKNNWFLGIDSVISLQRLPRTILFKLICRVYAVNRFSKHRRGTTRACMECPGLYGDLQTGFEPIKFLDTRSVWVGHVIMIFINSLLVIILNVDLIKSFPLKRIKLNKIFHYQSEASFVLVIAWFGGQLRINFLSKILKFFCNCPSL